MAKDKLIADEINNQWRLAWFLADEGEIGAILGEVTFTEKDLETDDAAELEHVAATLAASKTKEVERDDYGYFWPSERLAKAALSATKVAMTSAMSEKPWPDWALKAKAAGWKPPKGWEP